ncbi:MAG: hypothetical protein JNL82_02155 [Myxococcales bacterium]|nr:hypothetical protein [Myxococcales bacterium]
MAVPVPKVRSRGWWLGLALLVGLAGCHHQLPRLTARGQHAEVVARAAKARRPPRGKAARAWATSLTALGRTEEARAVLLRDFRRTSEVASLVALADLELKEGLRGLAAAHYSRAMSLGVDVLKGRREVCELMRVRARQFLAQGEAQAADLDMRRIVVACPPGKDPEAAQRADGDRALHREITAAAKVQVRAQRTLAGCEQGKCRAESSEQAATRLAAAVQAARAQGSASLRDAALRLGVQLTPRDVADLLAAELRGELGLDLVTHDEVRAWIGESAPVAIQAAISTLRPVEEAYVRLRVSQLGPAYELPGGDAARSTASLVVKLLELFDVDPSAAAMSWRVFVIVGDLPSAELALTTSLGGPRPRPVAEPSGPPPLLGDPAKAGPKDSKAPAPEPDPKDRSNVEEWTPAQTRVPVPSLWSARRAVDAASLPKLLLLARLRGLGGHDDQALAIAAYALAEAHARGLAGAEALAAAEAKRALADGQPWAALALAGVVPGAATAEVSLAAGASLALMQAACGRHCGADEPRDRVGVRQVFGEPWLLAEEARARDAALAQPLAPGPRDGCPGLGELLAPGATGPLPAALAAVRRGPAKAAKAPASAGVVVSLDEPAPALGAGEGLRRAVEADPTLICAGQLVTPLLYAGDHRVAATALADELIHAPQEIGARQLALQSELAVVLGRRDQADQMLLAAAAMSADPRRVHQRAIRMAGLVDARHYELLALRQAILHTPADEAGPLRLALTVRSLRDANDGWAVRSSEVGQEALLRGVQSYLEAEPPARRWRAREDLARALSGYAWADLQAAMLIRAAVWSEPGIEQQHPAAAARLERALGGAAEPLSLSPLAPAELSAALAGKDGPAPEVPAVGSAFVPVTQLQDARLEIARAHPDRQRRLQVAIAVATTGEPAARVEATRLLLAELNADAGKRDAVVDLLLAGLVAYDSGARPLIEVPEDLLAVVFGLARDPARARPEIKGDPLR